MSSVDITNTTSVDTSAYAAQHHGITGVNVGRTERLLSALGGGALAAYGITRLDWAGAGLALLGGALLYRGVTGHSYVYQALDIHTEDKPISNITPIPGKKGGVRVSRSITIRRTPQELYAYWRDVEKAPLYMPFVESVMKTGERTSHWVAQDPRGKTMEWNSELLQDQPGQLIAWHSHGTTKTANAGKVSFKQASGDRGTFVTLEMDYYQDAGNVLSGLVNTVMGKVSEFEALETLRRFKELMEAGEVASTKGQPTGEGRKE